MKPNAWQPMGNSTKINAGDWLKAATNRLRGRETPALEAQLVLARVLARPRASVLAHLDQALEPAQVDELERLLDLLEGGVPLPYVLGEQEFYGMTFKVSPAVLIPRPETELLVDEGLNWLKARPDRRRAADVGTGSGCIAAALAAHVPDLRLLAVDRSRAALEVARDNFRRHRLLERVRLAQSDLLSCSGGPFDLVCANLPYIPSRTLADLDVARHEPRSALDGGLDGLELIARLLADSRRWIAPGGLLLLEVESGQGQTAPALARQFFPSAEIGVKEDLAGHPRLLKIQLSS